MHNENSGFVIGMACALVMLAWLGLNEIRARRRANADISREIMAKTYNERAMHEAFVACEGDAPAARSMYIRTRLRDQRRHYRPSTGKAAGMVITAYIIGFMAGDTLLDAYTGDLFWWWQ